MQGLSWAYLKVGTLIHTRLIGHRKTLESLNETPLYLTFLCTLYSLPLSSTNNLSTSQLLPNLKLSHFLTFYLTFFAAWGPTSSSSIRLLRPPAIWVRPLASAAVLESASWFSVAVTVERSVWTHPNVRCSSQYGDGLGLRPVLAVGRKLPVVEHWDIGSSRVCRGSTGHLRNVRDEP